jgi:hypothetical protein
MSRIDELPPDQRAALSLLLREHRSYAQLATMLGIGERAVHDRAHAALAMLAPAQARLLSAEQRAEIGDYLLGQQPGLAERLATRSLLGSSESGRDWARALVHELAPLASRPLPEVPDGALASGDGAAAPAAAPANGSSAPSAAQPPSSRPRAAQRTGGAMAGALPSSRVGGALLLAALLAGVIVAIVLLTSGGGSSHRKTTAASTRTGSGSGPRIAAQLTLRPASSSSKTLAVVEILAEGSKRAYYIAAEHLPPTRGFSYVIWLYNSPTSAQALSRTPTIGPSERLAGGSLLPANASSYHEMLLTRETSSHPAHPGTIVLRGPFNVG